MTWSGLRAGSIRTIIRREYVTRVRTKSFLVMTFLVPILMVGSILLPLVFSDARHASQRRIALADETGVLADSIRVALDETLPDGRPRFLFDVVSSDSAGIREARELVRAKVYNALVVIPDTIFSGGSVVYGVNGTPNIGEMRRIESAVSRQVVAVRLWREGLDPRRIGALVRGVRIRAVSFGAARVGANAQAAVLGSVVMAVLMYFTLVLYGSWTMQGVIRDKTSRVVELLISTVSPTELMIGKITGIGAVGFTQIFLWLCALIAANFAAPQSILGDYLRAQSFLSVAAFVLFYVTGFLLYATLFAGVGAVSPSPEDAQQLVWPVVLVLMVPMLLIGPVIDSPTSPLFAALSFVPYFSPVIMLLRLNAGAAGSFEMIASLLLNMGTIFLTAWFVGRLFRIGMLLTGKRPTLREIRRWAREA